MFDNLDFETLEKIEKSFEMIEKRFGGDVNMQRAVLANYGIDLDNFPLVIEPSKQAQEFHQRNAQTLIDNEKRAEELQNKLIYGDKWFVLQNRLLNAISNLDLNERRLIMFLSPMVREDVEQNPNKTRRKFIVKALDFAKKYNIDEKNAYRVLANSAYSVLEKTFYFWNFKDDKCVERTYQTGSNWIEHCQYKENEGHLEIYLTSLTIEMLTVFDKANPFTKYEQDVIVKLGSYGIILFELIASCMHQQHKQKAYTINYLREKFNCVETYPELFNFKRYVLDRAIADIHEHTSYRIKYEQKKKGRIVSELVFSFEDTAIKGLEDKKKKGVGVERDPNTIDWVNGATDNEIKKAPSWQTKGLSDKQIDKIAVYADEFTTANSKFMSSNFRGSHNDLINLWRPMLKDPNQVIKFTKVQELLERKK